MISINTLTRNCCSNFIFLPLGKYRTMLTSTPRWWCKLPWLCLPLLFIHLTTFCMPSVSCYAAQAYYTDHCASIIPESTPSVRVSSTFPLLQYQHGYYAGGDRLTNQSSTQNWSHFLKKLLFSTDHVYKTDAQGVYKVEAHLTLLASSTHGREDHWWSQEDFQYAVGLPTQYGQLGFKLQGFWSKWTGKMCMVGHASEPLQEGNMHDLAVLKIHNVRSSGTTITSLISGTLERWSPTDHPNDPELISILIFPRKNYEYTLVSEDFDYGCSGRCDTNVEENLMPSLELSSNICWMLQRSTNPFALQYASDCKSEKNCYPFGEEIGYLPSMMNLNTIQCSEEKQSLSFLVESSHNDDYSLLNPNTTLVGEGSWDEEKNKLCVVACRLLNPTASWDKAQVGDCSFRLSLRFPAIWSIRNANKIVGQFWSDKTVNSPDYFQSMTFRSSVNSKVDLSGLKYEYTEISRVTKSCPRKQPAKTKNFQYPYPNWYFTEMNPSMSVKIPNGNVGSAIFDPLFVGDQLSQSQWSSSGTDFGLEAHTSHNSLINMSYKVNFVFPATGKYDGWFSKTNISSKVYFEIQVSAEGIYDAQTGSLCMVGCRELDLHSQASSNEKMDCEMLINVQFPPINSKKNGDEIKGSMESSREKFDPLYFRPLFLESEAPYSRKVKQVTLTTELEIILALISYIFTCIFSGFQLYHVKKDPDVLPFISIVMLGILTLGHIIPLVLNFEALFFQNHVEWSGMLRIGGWLKMNEVIVRLVMMAAFLIQLRLLQLTWSKRSVDDKVLWDAEKKVLFASLPLYITGFFVVSPISLMKMKKLDISMQAFDNNVQQHYLWGHLRSYASYVLDGFLFPQILLNSFVNIKSDALSHPFYFGSTFLRLIPHACDLYLAQSYDIYIGLYHKQSYYYVFPGAVIFSIAWDVIIPCGILLFAAVVYLQQRFGGRCFLPCRFRGPEEYNKVPVADG